MSKNIKTSIYLLHVKQMVVPIESDIHTPNNFEVLLDKILLQQSEKLMF